ncbi:MAG: hypothetical protein VX354_04385 [Pseudomonadota bacterium]
MTTNKILTVEEYNQAEKHALRDVPNRIIEITQPEAFQFTGYPSRIDDISALSRYVEVMHEGKIEYIWKNYLLEYITKEEHELIKDIAEQTFSMSSSLFSKGSVPTSNLLLALSIYRQIKFIFPECKQTIFEIGGGCGYLGALLASAGYKVISMDITQVFYLYQSCLYRTIFKDKFVELVNNKDSAANGDGASITHVPWWDFYTPNQEYSYVADAITCNHCLCEMHPWALQYVISAGKKLIAKSTEDKACFVFQAYGSPVKRSAEWACMSFYHRDFKILHNDPCVSVYADEHGPSAAGHCVLPDSPELVQIQDAYKPPVFSNNDNPISQLICEGRDFHKTKSTGSNVDLPAVLRSLYKIAGNDDLRTDDEKFFDAADVGLF